MQNHMLYVVHVFLKYKHMTFKSPDPLREDNLEYSLKEINKVVFLSYF